MHILDHIGGNNSDMHAHIAVEGVSTQMQWVVVQKNGRLVECRGKMVLHVPAKFLNLIFLTANTHVDTRICQVLHHVAISSLNWVSCIQSRDDFGHPGTCDDTVHTLLTAFVDFLLQMVQRDVAARPPLEGHRVNTV